MKGPFAKRIFTFNSDMLQGLHQGYDHLASAPQLATDGRSFVSYDMCIEAPEGYETVSGASTVDEALMNALSFDGDNDYSETDNDFPVETTNELTIEGNFYLDGNSTHQTIVCNHKDGDYGWWPFFNGDGNITIATSPDGSTWHFTDTGMAYPTGTWFHLAIVVNSSNRYLYIDGIQKWSDANGGINYPSGNTLALGMRTYYNNDDYNFGGKMSDLRIWSVARTETQIQDNKDSRLTGSETGLIAYYKWDEGSGTTMTDSAGSNDGTIYGASWVTEESLFEDTTELVIAGGTQGVCSDESALILAVGGALLIDYAS